MGQTEPVGVIGPEVIERIRERVAEFPDDVLDGEFEAFFSKQPEICNFITDLTSESGQQARELALFLIYMVYKAVAEGRNEDPDRVDAQTITSACGESREWIETMNGLEGADIDRSSVSGRDGQLHLLGFVIAEMNEAGLELSEEEKGTILFALKTVISSLTRRSQT